MSPQIQRPPGINVGVNNPGETSYLGNRTPGLPSNDTTDGSRRIGVNPSGRILTIEERTDGVWNLGPLQIAQSALFVGSGVSVAASGHNLLVTDTLNENLVISQEIFASGTGPPLSTLLGVEQIRVVNQPDNSLSLTLASHQEINTATGLFLVNTFYVQTGATAASADVSIIFTEGVPPDDVIFFEENFPASTFPADSEVVIDFTPGVQFDPDQQINSDFSSANAFTMKYNAAGTNIWNANDIRPLATEDILTESLLLAADLSLIFADNLVLVRGNEVF